MKKGNLHLKMHLHRIKNVSNTSEMPNDYLFFLHRFQPLLAESSSISDVILVIQKFTTNSWEFMSFQVLSRFLIFWISRAWRKSASNDSNSFTFSFQVFDVSSFSMSHHRFRIYPQEKCTLALPQGTQPSDRLRPFQRRSKYHGYWF